MVGTPTLRSAASTVYAHLLSDFFDHPTIVETRSTCDTCPMCNANEGCSEEGAVAGAVTFSPAVRCCTFYPPLPNFLVGALLRDTSADTAEGRRRIEQRIASGESVSPRWVKAPPSAAALHAGKIADGFGRAEELLCPYYSDASCTIWRFRDAVCSTYFCRHVGGARGQTFWGALRDYLLRVEVNLGRWAARMVDPTTNEPAADSSVSSKERGALFGAWAGREADFYRACYDVLGSLDRPGFESIVDQTPRASALLQEVRDRYRALTEPAPATKLVLSSTLKRARVPGGVKVMAYSPWDPQFLSDGLVRLLLSLRPDETVDAARERIRRDHGVDLPVDLIERLRAYEILVPPAEEP